MINERGSSMNTPMNINELVGALRSCSNPATRKPDCDNCPLFGERLCVKKMLEGAADLIESLQAQLEQKTNEAEGIRSNWYKCIENLKESQRREWAKE